MTASEFVNRLKYIDGLIDVITRFGSPNVELEPFTPNINMTVCYLNDIPAVHPLRLKFSRNRIA